ncbi:MAG: hypothetical protein GY729_03205 [Desulfobacteraceae bacterium]|nr:hypothetical protein [Desulfobacteraceae bacterium]
MKSHVLLKIIIVYLIILNTFHISNAIAKQQSKELKKISNPSSDNILRFAVHTSKIGSFDPHFAKGSQDFTVADMIFNGLLRYVPGKAPMLEPDIALKIPEFKIENGKQIWTIHLRKGIMFHPGPKTVAYELTSDDVIFSLQKAADPKRSSYANEYTGMEYKKINDYTLEIIVSKPVSPLFFLPKITNCRSGSIFSKKAIEALGYENYKEHPIGTGPFMFESYQPGEKLILKANDSYFRGKPLVSGVHIHFIPDDKKREAAFKNGTLDASIGVGEPGWIEMIEKEPKTIIDVFSVDYIGLFHFNTSTKPMDDIRVRKAICHALDRDAFLSTTSKRLVKKVYAPMPSGFLPGGIDNDKVQKLGLFFERDLAKAKKLLAQAGYANGFSLNLISSEKRVYRKSYQILKRQLSQIGIEINLTIVTHSKMHKLVRQNANPIVLYFTFRPDPNSYLREFFHSDSIVGSGKKPRTNFSHYTKADKLLDDARYEIDPLKQVNLWHQAQIKILNDHMVYPLFLINQICVRRDYVDYGHELVTTLTGYPQFTEKVRLKKDFK